MKVGFMKVEIISGGGGLFVAMNGIRIAGPGQRQVGEEKVFFGWDLDEEEVRDIISICLDALGCSATIYQNK